MNAIGGIEPREAVSPGDEASGKGSAASLPAEGRSWPLPFRSPLARKIIIYNLLGLAVLLVGILIVSPYNSSILEHRRASLAREAQLLATAIEAMLPEGPVSLAAGDGVDVERLLARLDLPAGRTLIIVDPALAVAARKEGPPAEADPGMTPITEVLDGIWRLLSAPFSASEPRIDADAPPLWPVVARTALAGRVVARVDEMPGGYRPMAAAPIRHGKGVAGAVVFVEDGVSLMAALARERERLFQLFAIAAIVSIALSLVLAATIANPLNDLAAAAESGDIIDEQKGRGGRRRKVRIPDLSDRPDEIGRLSAAFRRMIAALYDRIEANEQFAADVAHEIKNPLGSLRSAVATLRHVKNDSQREKLLDVIDHDVRRLDRLVSDISNASRLDAELVKEEMAPFDLVRMLEVLAEFHRIEAEDKGIDFITDLPGEPIVIKGLEARLAQVVVNLLSNAISFCEAGDAIRLWARRKGDRVLIVVEDTGPGIPEEALEKIFSRFYSQRPADDFGNHSGLGLAISKQIVEAHGGVIWAENIRPGEEDPTSEPLGARFVVGLPL